MARRNKAVKVTDNFDKAFPSKKVKAKEKLTIPVFGFSFPMVLGIRVEATFLDPVNEEKITGEAMQKIDEFMPELKMELTAALNGALTASVWAWKDGGMRDIVDTGQLAATLSIETSGSGVKVSYSSPYANLVHNGGYIQPYGNKAARPIYLPARPWVKSVMEGGGPVPQFDIQEFFLSRLS